MHGTQRHSYRLRFAAIYSYPYTTGKSSAIFVRYACNGDLSMNSFTCIVQRVITCMVGSLLVAMSTFYDGNDISPDQNITL